MTENRGDQEKVEFYERLLKVVEFEEQDRKEYVPLHNANLPRASTSSIRGKFSGIEDYCESENEVSNSESASPEKRTCNHNYIRSPWELHNSSDLIRPPIPRRTPANEATLRKSKKVGIF